ncbi:MAG: Gfo/Idh/MocA family oxidoreductase [Planctomycetaceae bacterium]|nr:Gfo/Idh/MocA family oxidoreductase [Planctomycetales bacterium]MCB9926354.1 Gfo/Idh/MocA family oxidoreductase [Planctomycetaceae bacterium]
MRMQTTRRTFLKNAAAASVAVPTFVSSSVFGANDRLNIAGIGVGGKGRGDIENTSQGQNVVAICDVDDRTLGAAEKKYPGAKAYNDWRRLLEQTDIDAVTVSTPDHMHAPIAISAMQLGKHVYVQKPLAHTVHEARQMQLLAKQYGVVSQMGNQGHGSSSYRTLVKLIQNGTIGKVKEAHAWSNRPIWPQGIDRPPTSDPVPGYLHWDLWLGVAKTRPFVGASEGSKRERGLYHPFNWRGWLDFGVGALGDMGCHIIDPVVWSCGLGAPTKVWSNGPAPNGETFPNWGIINYEFAGTHFTVGDAFRMTWYDGGKKPAPELAPLPDGESLPDNGSLFVGEKGVLLCKHGGSPQLLPTNQFAGIDVNEVAGHDHYMQWTNACKGEGKTSSHFDYAGPLTETVLLGTIAIRFPGQAIEWDSDQLKVTNVAAANAFVRKSYRDGWQVKGLA